MKRSFPKQAGAVAVEFAFVLIPLLVVLAGITEFGRAMYYYNTIAKAARDAARLMSTQTPSDPDYSTLVSNATCLAVYGNSACTGSPLIPGLTTAMVSICDPSNCPSHNSAYMCPVPPCNAANSTGVMNLVTVTVGGSANPYTFVSMAPFPPGGFGISSIPFAAISVTMRQVM